MRENLKNARKAAGMTQQQVADKLGISERYYRFIESGNRTGDFEIWDTLEDLFGIHQRILRELSPIRGHIEVMGNSGELKIQPSDFFIPSTYRVVWCSQEGIQQERSFDNLQDACIEYVYVNEHYDGADILDENGNPVRWV